MQQSSIRSARRDQALATTAFAALTWSNSRKATAGSWIERPASRSRAVGPGSRARVRRGNHKDIRSPHQGTALTDLDGVIDCVDSTADSIVDELLCKQFPNGGACPTPVATPTPTPISTP